VNFESHDWEARATELRCKTCGARWVAQRSVVVREKGIVVRAKSGGMTFDVEGCIEAGLADWIVSADGVGGFKLHRCGASWQPAAPAPTVPECLEATRRWRLGVTKEMLLEHAARIEAA